jgi:DNA-binding transcriptional LysR family regulator
MKADLNRLRHIVTIDRTRSFTRAAEELLITQPALSRSIAGFEDYYGVRLFDRGRGGVVPTAVGKLIIAEARRVLETTRDFEHNLMLYGSGKAGRIAIGFGPLTASLIVPPLGRHILAEHPGLHFHASIKHASDLLRQLLDDEIEMIFANSFTIQDSREVAAQPIGTLELLPFVRSGHPLAGKANCPIGDLNAYPAASAAELPTIGLTGKVGAVVCDNYHILRDLLLSTDCICLGTHGLFDDDIAKGRLVTLDVADMNTVQNRISVVRRRGRTIPPISADAIEFVRGLFPASG